MLLIKGIPGYIRNMTLCLDEAIYNNFSNMKHICRRMWFLKYMVH